MVRSLSQCCGISLMIQYLTEPSSEVSGFECVRRASSVELNSRAFVSGTRRFGSGARFVRNRWRERWKERYRDRFRSIPRATFSNQSVPFASNNDCDCLREIISTSGKVSLRFEPRRERTVSVQGARSAESVSECKPIQEPKTALWIYSAANGVLSGRR